MAVNRGKQFEQKFKEDFLRIPNSVVYRIPDQVSGYAGTSQNLCDFFGYVYPHLFLLECKTIKGNTFPLSGLGQYDKLLPYIGISGLRVGVVIWFQDHNTVLYVPISTIRQMKIDGKKSVNIKMIQTNEYNIKVIPSIPKRVFLDSDYRVLLELKEGE